MAAAARCLPMVVLLLVPLALAGCGQPDGPQRIEVSPGQVVVVEEAPEPGNGRVAGLVGDDALYPLADVRISLLGSELNTTTDDTGRFALVDVPPGIYIVEASLKDHASAQTTVDVQPDATARAVLLLPRIPATDPYHVTIQHEGYVQLSAGDVYVLDRNNSFSFTLDDSAPKTIVLESKWTGTFLGTGQSQPLQYTLTDVALHTILEEPMPNPFVARIDPRILTPGHHTFGVAITANRPEPVLYQGRSQDFLTVFYNQEAPSDWSILGGST